MAVSITGGFRWDCQNPDCQPVPAFERLDAKTKAKMKKPGENAWNDFQASMKGQGYTQDQLRDMYRQKELQLAATAEDSSESALASTGRPSSATTRSKAAKAKAVETGPLPVLNLNTCTRSELLTVDGLGQTLVDRVLELRAKKGEFQKVADLLEVEGIVKAKFGAIMARFIVHPPRR